MDDTQKEYTISEVSEITTYPSHVLRYYEKEFEINIQRNDSNHRIYTYQDIETFNYIKSLQEKEFSNKQIKLILDSPEEFLNEQQEEIAVSSTMNNELISENKLMEMSSYLSELIIDEIKSELIVRDDMKINAIKEMKEEIESLRKEIRSKERDVLICENAKLKMKVKEKSYELVDVKEKLKYEKGKKNSIIGKLFKK